MGATYDAIASTTLGTAATNITFSSIPATYTDLRVVFVGQGNTTQTPNMQFNGDTGNNYSALQMQGDGGGVVYSQSQSNASAIRYLQIPNNGGTPNDVDGAVFYDILNYRSAIYKTVLGADASDTGGGGNVNRTIGMWLNTAAITSLAITTQGSSTYSAGTIVTLYGIVKA